MNRILVIAVWLMLVITTDAQTTSDNPINRCSSYPCQNRATCLDGADTYQCICAVGFTGVHCETTSVDTASARVLESTEFLSLEASSVESSFYAPTFGYGTDNPADYTDGCFVEIRSWGMADSERFFGYIRVNGETRLDASSPDSARGISTIVLNRQNCSTSDGQHFDTYYSTSESDRLAIYLLGLPPATVLIGVSADEASNSLTSEVREILGGLGVNITEFGYYWKLAFVAVVGSPDSAVVSIKSPGSNVLLNVTVTESNVRAFRYWMPSSSDSMPYLRVNLPSSYLITGLKVQGDTDFYPRTVTVLYSTDGWSWQWYADGAGAKPTPFYTQSGRNITSVVFNAPLSAVSVVVIVMDAYQRATLKLELVGCKINNELPRYTNVERNLAVNTTWTLSDSPYVISQMITVFSGAYLTVEPGVVMVFTESSAGLTIEGCATFGGNAGSEVSLVSDNPLAVVSYADDSGSCFWNGLTFSSNIGCAVTLISYTRLSGANNAIRLNGNIQLQITDSIIEGNKYGVLANTYSFTLQADNTNFTENDYGIYFNLYYNCGNILMLLTNARMREMKYSGIYFAPNYNYGCLRIQLNAIHSLFDQSPVELYGWDNTVDVLFETTIFYESPLVVSVGQIIRLSANDVNFTRSAVNMHARYSQVLEFVTVLFVTSDVTVGDDDDYWTHTTVTGLFANSTFSKATSTALTVYVRYSYYHCVLSLTVTGNVFDMNRASTCIDINSADALPGSTLLITDNTFFNNTVSKTISVCDTACGVFINVTGNAFSNPGSTYDLFICTPWKLGYVIEATNNWWDSLDDQYATSRIYDFFDDISLAPVNIDTACDSVLCDNIITTHWNDWFVSNGTVGGRLTQNVTLIANDNSTFIVTRTIHVPPGLSLIIKVPFGVEFSERTGILLEDSSLTLTDTRLNSGMGIKGRGVGFVSLAMDNSSVASTSDSAVNIISPVATVTLLLSSVSSTSAQGNAVYMSGSVLSLSVENSTVLFASSNAIHLVGNNIVSVDVKHSAVTSARDTWALFVQGPTFISINILYSIIQGEGKGIYLESDITGGFFTIEGCRFENIVQMSTLRANFTAIGNTFLADQCIYATNSYYRYIWYDYFDSSWITIDDNVFMCRTRAIFMDSNGRTQSFTIINNIFNATANAPDYAVYLLTQIRNEPLVQVSRNTFDTLSSPALGVRLLRLGSQPAQDDLVSITDNRFYNNGGPTTASIMCQVESTVCRASILLSRNTFLGSTASSSTLLTNCPRLNVTENIFRNPQSSYEYMTSVPYSDSLVMYAARNYWNVTSLGDVYSRVFDNQDSPSVAAVELSPWYSDSQFTSLIDVSGFFKGETDDYIQIGGTLKENTVLGHQIKPYEVVESIFVPFGIVFEIEAGTDLQFKQGGIVVEGTLKGKGTQEDWITCQPRSELSIFSGITFRQRVSDWVRLSGSEVPNEGRLEIFYNGTWGTVCWDYFEDVDASVACVSLGYSDGGQALYSKYGPGSEVMPIWLDDLGCSGTETFIGYCRHNGWAVTNCDHQRDVSIVCFGEQSVTPTFNNGQTSNDTSSEMYFTRVISPSVGIVINHQAPTMEYFTVENSTGNGITINGASVDGRLPRLDNFLVSHSRGNGLVIDGLLPSNYYVYNINDDSVGDFSIANCNISYNGGSGLTLSQTVLTNDYAVGNFSITNCNISFNGGSGLSLSQTVLSSTLEGTGAVIVSGCTFVANTQYGVYVISNNMVMIKNCTIEGNHNTGIYLQPSSTSPSWIPTLFVADNRLISNNGDGVSCVYSYSHCFFYSNVISRNEGRGINCDIGYWWWYNSIPQCTVERNFVSENAYGGIWCRGSSCFVSLNVIINHSAIGYDRPTVGFYYVPNVLLTGNIIEMNDVFGSYWDAILRFQECDSVTVYNNSVTANRAAFAAFRITSCNHMNITSNTFVNNTSLYPDSGWRTVLFELSTPPDRLSVSYNVFNNPDAWREIVIETSRSDPASYPVVDLAFNFWDRQNYSAILQRIYSFYNDMNKMAVNIWPALLDSTDTMLLLEKPANESYFLEEGIGGEITSAIRIPYRNEPYIVSRSIVISETGTLIIEGGTVLQFLPGRGILSFGSLVVDSSDLPVNFNCATPGDRWYGMTIVHVQNENYSGVDIIGLFINDVSSGVQISGTDISFTSCNFTNVNSGMRISGTNISFVMCNFANVNSGMTNSGTSISFVMCNFSQVYSGLILGGSNALVTKCSFSNSDIGLISSVNRIVVTESIFLRNTVGLQNQYQSSSSVTVEGCTFIENLLAIMTYLTWNTVVDIIDNEVINGSSNYYYYTTSGIYAVLNAVSRLNVYDNTFQNLPYFGVRLEYSISDWSLPIPTIAIARNNFRHNYRTAVMVYYAGFMSISIEDNDFIENTCSSCPSAISLWLNIDWCCNRAVQNSAEMRFNQFTQNEGNFVVQVGLSAAAVTPGPLFSYLSFVSNALFDNRPTVSALYTEYYLLNVSYNIFSNPLAPYEFSVGFTGNLNENCTQNWWRSTDSSEIAGRIYDQVDVTTLGLVLYEPFLNSSQFSCSSVNDCSLHGSCILPETCRCDAGWQGADCDTVSCSLVGECNGRGNCTGPNICQCEVGWSPPDCTRPSCSLRRNCNNHGTCIGPNTCQCTGRYAGESCTDCISGYWGSYCLPCPQCVHGACQNSTGKCLCNGANWVGELCDHCALCFSGPSCDPLPEVLYLDPSAGSDLGGTVVHVHGCNLPNTTTYRCMFDQQIVTGTWISDTEALCISPNHTAGSVTLQISTSEEMGFIISKADFSYYPTCPPGACGAQLVPAHGYCSIGRCQCILPWMGQDCDIVGIAPSVVPVGTLNLFEGQVLNTNLNTSQGTAPVSWSLLSSPAGVVMNSQTGRLQWMSAVASNQPYRFQVACENLFGSSSISFNVTVPPAYTAVLDPVSAGPFVRPPSFIISGRVVWKSADNKIYFTGKQVPVNILINSTFTLRTLSLSASFDTDIFFIRYSSPQSDAGRFQLDARHPADSGFETQRTWTVYGLSLQVNPTYLSGYTGHFTYPSFITVINTGVDPLTVVELQQVILPFDLQLSGNISGSYQCSVSLTKCQLTTVLQPGQFITLNATLQADLPYNGWFAIRATSSEGVVQSAVVSYDFRPRLPVLTLSPNWIDVTITRGSTYYYQVNVTNIGLARATNVVVNLPQDNTLSLVSFGKNATMSATSMLVLETGESALLLLSFMATDEVAIGERNGYMSITSIETSAQLTYRVVVASVNRLNLTVTVEDEYTYFSDDHPLLSGATIRLTSNFGGETISLTTNISGSVMFMDIREDYYNLETYATKHQSDSRVIFATSGSGSSVRVFLQRTAVTYSWTVTPVSYQDEYVISLEADFETYVPIPVVTVSPTQLDLEVLENGLMPVVNFEITNHGLISARHFTFTLPPDNHPFMKLHMDSAFIGDIPANTTIYVPMKVIINETKKLSYFNTSSYSVTKRSAEDIVRRTSSIIQTVYDYLCDTEKYVYIYVYIILNQVSEPTSCVCPAGNFGGYGGSGGGDVGGGGPGVWDVPTSVTSPMTCDKLDNCVLGPLTCFEAIFDVVKCIQFARSLTKAALKAAAGDFAKKKETWDKIAAGAEALANGNTEAAKEAAKGVATGLMEALFEDCYRAVDNGITCYQKLKKCYNISHGAGRRKRSTALSRHDMLPEMIRRTMSVFQFVMLVNELPGDAKWYYIANGADWWQSTLQPSLSYDSDGGRLITFREYTDILASPLPGNATTAMVESLLHRINNTLSGHTDSQNNSIDFVNVLTIGNTLLTDTRRVGDLGFESLVDWFEDGYNSYLLADQTTNEGVCAKVRIQIVQKVTLTRTGFNARLEIDNGETNTLANIKVVIDIRHMNNTVANSKFVIGIPQLNGLSSVNGTGQLAVGAKGIAEWLIIPYSTAAPIEDVQYNIGGTLYYTVDGDELTVPLFPDTVTVKPDPRLYLNYFMEKYVYAGDPLASLDVFKSSVPFSLGILVTNNGYGVATDLGITSAQPVIIDNEKGLLVRFQIIGAELGNTGLSASLTVRFGDVQPHTTKMARWIMTSSLSGTFSNYSATFTNKNPLGDPGLSVMESVLYHELMHVVKVDYPSDDGIADFLVVNQYAIDYVPNKLYLSDNGITPLTVRIGNVTNVNYVSMTRIQISVNSSWSSWVYFRSDYNPHSSSSTLYSVTRSDGRIINADFNVWFSLINNKVFLNILDYMPYADSSFTYTIVLSRGVGAKPIFNSTIYYMNISEGTSYSNALLTVTANNDDPLDTMSYSIQSSSELPFSLDPSSGHLTLTAVLDREQLSSYSILVQAVDHGYPQQTGTAVVVVTVEDVNDNAPVFGSVPSDVTVEEILEPGNSICDFTVSDADSGANGEVMLTLEDGSGLFALSATSNSVIVHQSLQGRTGSYNVTVTARDLGSPALSSSILITIHVVKNNLYAPVFSSQSYNFQANETDELLVVIGQLVATDADNSDEVLTYSLGSIWSLCAGSFPFMVHQMSGIIQNILPLDRHTCVSYMFTVAAADSGAPPTGSLNSSVNVTVSINAVNRFDPHFDLPSYQVHIVEKTEAVTTLLELRATDRDSGINGNITGYTLSQNDDNFRLDVIGDTAYILAVKPLDFLAQNRYELTVTATDEGVPPRSATVDITVIVDQFVDNSPVFVNNSANITIPRSLPVNYVFFTVNAKSFDSAGVLYYSLSDPSNQYISCGLSSGQLSLKQSLVGSTFTTVTVEVSVSDGTRSSRAPFLLTITVTDVNTFPPVFDTHQYNVTVNESTPIGTQLVQLSASDRDNPLLTFVIAAGDSDRRFKLDALTGVLTLYAPLDYESRNSYILTVVVSDGANAAVNVLNDTATVLISVLDANEFDPVFTDGPSVQLHVIEGTVVRHLWQFQATDGDGENITYRMYDENEMIFSVEPLTGWLNVDAPLSRAVHSQYMTQVAAVDNGVPNRQTVIDVYVIVDSLPATATTGDTSTGVSYYTPTGESSTSRTTSMTTTTRPTPKTTTKKRRAQKKVVITKNNKKVMVVTRRRKTKSSKSKKG